MILLYSVMAIVAFSACLSIILIKKYNKEGQNIKNLESGFIIAPSLSFGFLITFLFLPATTWDKFLEKYKLTNPLPVIKYLNACFTDWLSFLHEYQLIAFILMPVAYGYTCYFADKNNYSKINKIMIDFVFATLMVLSLPYNTYFLKNLFSLPLWLDNLLIILLCVFLVNAFKKENDFDGFSSMFVTIMGLGVCALMLPLHRHVNNGVTYLGIVVAFTSLVFFALNSYPAKIKMSNSGVCPLILSFIWVCLQFSFAGKELVIFCIFAYIIFENIVSLIKMLLNKIPLIKKIEFNPKPYYIVANERGQTKDKIITYIVKWNILMIMIAFYTSSPNIKKFLSYITFCLIFVSYWISFNLSKYGEKEPSIKEITTDVSAEFKRSFHEFKELIKNRKNKNDEK
ncbi:MAG: Glycosyl transferase family 4 [Alphaproteobacteria bacterium ADurb.Bin438]|nr:MAG: Glycosyl transferase family 4 [Alphaproteobacteria bacterium ADurb.Bin438]